MALTDAMNRYPRPCTVSINCGVRLITQHTAELPHGHRDHVLTQGSPGPDGGQRLFSHELARLGHQAGEDGKGFRGQTDHRGTAPQAFVPEVELKRAKHKALRFWHMSPFPRPAEAGQLPGCEARPCSEFFQQFFTISSGLGLA